MIRRLNHPRSWKTVSTLVCCPGRSKGKSAIWNRLWTSHQNEFWVLAEGGLQNQLSNNLSICLEFVRNRTVDSNRSFNWSARPPGVGKTSRASKIIRRPLWNPEIPLLRPCANLGAYGILLTSSAFLCGVYRTHCAGTSSAKMETAAFVLMAAFARFIFASPQQQVGLQSC